jgi:serine/threonine protein kinase
VSDVTLGTQIGNSVLEATLGRGGMGVVYLARDLALQRQVAVKLLAPELAADAGARARFQQEIKASVAIEHLPEERALRLAGRSRARSMPSTSRDSFTAM